jgi:iron-sulfur cluster repair protein YtfE (RIC family)
MTSIGDFMTRGHKECDGAFARAEKSAGDGDWSSAAAGFKAFLGTMVQHLAMEEEVLFPAFEDATGMSGGGPTETMRAEHAQMRGLFDEMRNAIDARDADQYLGLSESLLVLMQQHNLKEEGMLYPMMDQVLGSQAGDLIGRCNAVDAQAA